MDLEAAKELAEDFEGDYKRPNRVYNGLVIAMKYVDDVVMTAEHDQIWIHPLRAPSEDLITDMSDEDLREMLLNCWFIDTEIDAWSHFV